MFNHFLFKIDIEEFQDENIKKELKEELEEKLSKAKRRSLGNIRFVLKSLLISDTFSFVLSLIAVDV